MKILIILSVLFFSNLSFSDVIKTCDVNHYGAKGDGETVNTVAIQAAIDECSKTGGVVSLHDGIFLTGMIKIKSGIELRIEPSAVLKGTQNILDYPDLFPATQNSQLSSCRKALVYVDAAQNVVITGGGTIDGNGINPRWRGKEYTRPMAVFAALSNHITIENIKVKDSAMWSVVAFETDNVHINGIEVNSDYGHNRDGIDIVDGHHVLIENSIITSQDDSVCLKSGSARGVYDVTVRNLHIKRSTDANGLKMGTASTGFFKKILFENIQMEDVHKAAMAVESVDGADIDDVQFHHIRFENTGSAVFLILGRRANPLPPKVGTIQNVLFEDIQGTTDQRWGSVITGTIVDGKTYAPTGIQIKNMSVINCSSTLLIPSEPPEYAGQYPDPDLWKTLPAYGFYIRHIDSIQIKNTTVEPGLFERREKILTRDVIHFLSEN